MADDQKTPLDLALDLFVYAPLGLAFTARDELPNLVEKGRSRLTAQLTMAKMIGQFAATQGQQEAQKAAKKTAQQLADQVGTIASRLGGFPGVPGSTGGAAGAARSAGAAADASRAAADAARTARAAAPRTATATASPSHNGSNGATPRPRAATAPKTAPSAAAPAKAAPTQAAVRADTLAIHGYDTLSASQVVQRLAGLAAPELDAVGHYEEANRGRRTILAKVAQLQAERS